MRALSILQRTFDKDIHDPAALSVSHMSWQSDHHFAPHHLPRQPGNTVRDKMGKMGSISFFFKKKKTPPNPLIRTSLMVPLYRVSPIIISIVPSLDRQRNIIKGNIL